MPHDQLTAACLVLLERFLRILPALGATDQDTLPNLLERATGRNLRLVATPSGEDGRAKTLEKVRALRNAFLHGNYEQAVALAGLSSVADYFGQQYAKDVEWLFAFTNNVMSQIDAETGEPYPRT